MAEKLFYAIVRKLKYDEEYNFAKEVIISEDLNSVHQELYFCFAMCYMNIVLFVESPISC